MLGRFGTGVGAAILIATVLVPSAGGVGGTAPRIRSVHLSNKVFAVGPGNTPLQPARRTKVGTKLRVTLTKAGQIIVVVQRRAHGRRAAAGDCVPLRHGNRHRPKCTRLSTKMTLTRIGHAGKNGIRFSGRSDGIVLNPGAFQFSIRALSLDGT